MKKILILFGGNSEEHKISCLSAKTILEKIDRTKYEVSSVGIDRNNNWYIFNDSLELLKNNTWKKGNINKLTNIVEYLKTFDKVFPIIHGNPEENGNLQGLFNLFNIKYVGSGLLGSIISYDKDITKKICNNYNIPIIPSITITNNKKIKKINIDFPVIIKPSKSGSSIGINIANNIKELNKYLKEAFKYDNKVIIEKYINAREFECSILQDKKIKISPVGEIKSSNKFYDYIAKYEKESNLLIPAPISKKLEKQIKELSYKIYNILELKDLARIDFLYDYNNNILYFNEVNTMPGFTDISMYPLLFKEYGINIKNLITKLIND